MQPNARIPRVRMQPAAKVNEIGVSEVAFESGRPVRGLYDLRAKNPKLWALLVDGVRYRRLSRQIDGWRLDQ